jgi:protein involved in polysaccharide export with SLBB domain
VLLAGLACAGCSYLELGVSSDLPEWNESYLVAEKSPEQLRAARLAKVLAVWSARPQQEPGDYVIGPDDVLEVGIYALEEPGKTAMLTRAVSHQGQIGLPWVGPVQVAGLSAPVAEAAIRACYEKSGYLKGAQVSVRVVERHSAAIVVSGAVTRPDVYPLMSNRSTVLESLARAGGLTKDAGEEAILVRNPGRADAAAVVGGAGGGTAAPAPEVIPIDLKELIDSGNMLLNLQMSDGDVLTVPPRDNQYVYVLGYVRRPGAYKLEEAARVDALRAVALGGGLMGTGRGGNSYLVREKEKGQETIPVDLSKLASGEAPPLYLRAGDTLIVGTSLWGRISEFLSPSMGASISASASVAP